MASTTIDPHLSIDIGGDIFEDKDNGELTAIGYAANRRGVMRGFAGIIDANFPGDTDAYRIHLDSEPEIGTALISGDTFDSILWVAHILSGETEGDPLILPLYNGTANALNQLARRCDTTFQLRVSLSDYGDRAPLVAHTIRAAVRDADYGTRTKSDVVLYLGNEGSDSAKSVLDYLELGGDQGTS